MSNVVSKKLKAYLSYSHGDDITTISALLNECGVSVYDSNKMLQIRDSMQLSMVNAIKECDFVVLVYSTDNAYIGFETGIAVASNLPIFAIINPIVDDPYFLYDSTWIRSLPTDRSTIQFSFDIFMKGIEYLAKRPSKSKSKENANIAKQPVAKDLAVMIRNFDFSNERTMASFIMQVLLAYGIKAIENPGDYKEDFPADFSIWSDPLQGILTNPIKIEIKKRLTEGNLNTFYKSVTAKELTTLSGSWIIFYSEISQKLKNDLRQSSRVLFIDIHNLADKLLTLSFNDAIKQLRNDLVHKI